LDTTIREYTMTKSSEALATSGSEEQKAEGNSEPSFTFNEVIEALRAETDKLMPDNALLEGAKAGIRAKVVEAMVNGARKTVLDNDGNTPMHLAVMSGNRDLVQFMIGQEFAADLMNKAGFTPLNYTVDGKHADIASDLAVAGADVNHAIPGLNETLLMIAAYRNIPAFVEVLLMHGARTDERDSNGVTAFMRAAGQGNLDCLRLLMGAGADPYLKSNTGRTVFDFAKRTCGPQLVECLANYLTEYTQRIAREGSAKPVSTMKTISLRKTEYIPNG
jgi:ankyrin repeat protein